MNAHLQRIFRPLSNGSNYVLFNRLRMDSVGVQRDKVTWSIKLILGSYISLLVLLFLLFVGILFLFYLVSPYNHFVHMMVIDTMALKSDFKRDSELHGQMLGGSLGDRIRD